MTEIHCILFDSKYIHARSGQARADFTTASPFETLGLACLADKLARSNALHFEKLTRRQLTDTKSPVPAQLASRRGERTRRCITYICDACGQASGRSEKARADARTFRNFLPWSFDVLGPLDRRKYIWSAGSMQDKLVIRACHFSNSSFSSMLRRLFLPFSQGSCLGSWSSGSSGHPEGEHVRSQTSTATKCDPSGVALSLRATGSCPRLSIARRHVTRSHQFLRHRTRLRSEGSFLCYCGSANISDI